MAAFTWVGPAVAPTILNIGPLAVLAPLLDRLDLARIIDRHLPADSQLEFSHGDILSLLLAARLSKPNALVNVAQCGPALQAHRPGQRRSVGREIRGGTVVEHPGRQAQRRPFGPSPRRLLRPAACHSGRRYRACPGTGRTVPRTHSLRSHPCALRRQLSVLSTTYYGYIRNAA